MSKPQKPDHRRVIRRRKGTKPTPETETESTKDTVATKGVAPAPTPVTNPEPPAPPAASLDGDVLLAEIESMGADAFAALMADGSPSRLQAGDQVMGTVVRTTQGTVFVDVGAKAEGFLDAQEFGESIPKIGDKVQAFIVDTGDSIRLSKQLRGDGAWEGVSQAFESGEAVEGQVQGSNPGGLVVKLGDIRAFCPISQIARNVPADLTGYIGQTLPFKVIELKDNEVVVSHRQFSDAEAEARSASLWTTIEEGETVEGVVTNIRDFGVFVDIGGIEGLVPRSELGWTRKAEAPPQGAQVQARIIKIDRLEKRLSLSLKDQSADPWAQVGRAFLPGGVYNGKVTRLTDFGAFISLAPGLEGLAHISKLSTKHIQHPKDVLEVGQELDIRIDSIDAGRKRISLAIPREGDDEAQSAPIQPQKEQSLGTLADLFGGLELPK